MYENIILFILLYTKKSIVIVRKFFYQIFTKISVFITSETNLTSFIMIFVCKLVCISHNSKMVRSKELKCLYIDQELYLYLHIHFWLQFVILKRHLLLSSDLQIFKFCYLTRQRRISSNLQNLKFCYLTR